MRVLYYDIEVSPNVVLAWGAGYKERISYLNILKERAVICIAWKWEHEDNVYALSWDDGDDKKLLASFSEVAKNADVLCAHNGDNFDLKWLKTRFLKHGISFPAKPVTRDTLKRARGNFRFNSNRLDYIAKFLGFSGKHSTDFNLWADVMNGDKEALDRMVEYCKNDVVILEKVDKEITRLTPVEMHRGVMLGEEKWTCPQCGGNKVYQNKRKTTATGVVKYDMKCNSCKRYYTISQLAYMNYLKLKK